MLVQYSGFAVVAGGREYSFHVSGPNHADRSFTLVIEKESFRQGSLKYQEGPDLCYRKLLSGLAAEQKDSPLRPRQHVSELEVAEYTASSHTKSRAWTAEQRLAARQRFRAGRAEWGTR